MSDLIDKLRAATCAGTVYPMMCEADAEIERLTALLDAEMESNKLLCERELALAIENEKLKQGNATLFISLQAISKTKLNIPMNIRGIASDAIAVYEEGND